MSAMQAARRRAHKSALTQSLSGNNAPATVTSGFAWRMFMVIAVMSAITLVISIGGRMVGDALATGGHALSTEIHTIEIAGNTLTIPENIIRFKTQRVSGRLERLDLYLLYPQMTGYTQETKDWFNDRTEDRRLVFMTLEESQMSRDMSGRLDPIYRVITRPAASRTEAGLEIHEFLPSAGYSNEELLVSPASDGAARFVVRCMTGAETAIALGVCERDIRVGDNLSLTYRFPRTMLSQWRQLEANVRAFALKALGMPVG